MPEVEFHHQKGFLKIVMQNYYFNVIQILTSIVLSHMRNTFSKYIFSMTKAKKLKEMVSVGSQKHTLLNAVALCYATIV